jgi:hypothetical protein
MERFIEHIEKYAEIEAPKIAMIRTRMDASVRPEVSMRISFNVHIQHNNKARAVGIGTVWKKDSSIILVMSIMASFQKIYGSHAKATKAATSKSALHANPRSRRPRRKLLCGKRKGGKGAKVSKSIVKEIAANAAGKAAVVVPVPSALVVVTPEPEPELPGLAGGEGEPAYAIVASLEAAVVAFDNLLKLPSLVGPSGASASASGSGGGSGGGGDGDGGDAVDAATWRPIRPGKTDLALIKRVLGPANFVWMTKQKHGIYYDPRSGEGGVYYAVCFFSDPGVKATQKGKPLQLAGSRVAVRHDDDHPRAIRAVWERTVLIAVYRIVLQCSPM